MAVEATNSEVKLVERRKGTSKVNAELLLK